MKPSLMIAAICIFLSSCCIQSKIDEVRRVVANAKDTLRVEQQQLSGVKHLAAIQLAGGKIDSTILSLLVKRLSKFESGMGLFNSRVEDLEKFLSDVSLFRKNYKSVIRPLVSNVKEDASSFQQKIVLYEMISNGLNIADYKLFDLAAFFGPGKYAVPTEMKDAATGSFAPIVDSIIQFSNKYKDIQRTGSLIILGFADGTGFSEGPLVDFLSSKIGKTNATKEELNQKLSELRAQELISLLSNRFDTQKASINNSDKLRIEYFGKGRGESLPLPTITNYQVSDDRRRIVLCYWTILPD